jgi:RNA polymerase sigma-70 factor, ECF subfamily
VDDDFVAERERLWGLAYRICGTRADADDVVQEAWLRWNAADKPAIERPAAWLTTVTSRVAIDRLRARRRRTESYVGPWLPDMIVTPSVPDHSTLIDSLTVGFLTLLERLDPVERVVFLLSDVFGETFAEIATTVGKSEAACRQIASRARRRVRDPERKRPASVADQQRLTSAFASAVVTGDLGVVASLLSSDAVLVSDGGAAVHAARRPVVGADRIARFLVNVTKRYGAAGIEYESAAINGEPGVIARHESRTLLAMVIHCSEPEAGGEPCVDEIYILRNPEKLRSLRLTIADIVDT